VAQSLLYLCVQSLLCLLVGQLMLPVVPWVAGVRLAACVSLWHTRQGLGGQASQLMLPGLAQEVLLALQQLLSLLLRPAAAAGC
jgi:hypothetical protein